MTNSLKNKVAIVTGGSRGIGAAIVRRLAADGATVVLTYHSSPGKAETLVSEVQAWGGKAKAIQADAGNPDQVRAAVNDVFEAFGKIDILVNNAGILVLGNPGEVTSEDYQRMLAVNVTGMVAATEEALKHMGQGGRIVHIGSNVTQYVGFGTISLYTLTKGAVSGYTRGLVRDLGPRGITVNTVQPGPVETDMNPIDGPVAEVMLPRLAVGRYGQGKDIAGAVAYLVSHEADFVTGAELLVDGGFSA
ncbi:3-oxoacyl-ACP reductase family protein [Salinicola halimionae]|uniref:3-oxoacyl-ACP reductase family protein n=1 Tax=Salinicola halimionae TaxID=1949081 RepID=UPI000DA13DD5|nr:3-oxoacyl-ACP reductase family protein [Salinicola halimionae]